MKLGLSNQAQYFKDNNVADKVKAIEDKISGMLMNKPEYTNGFRTTIIKKNSQSQSQRINQALMDY